MMQDASLGPLVSVFFYLLLISLLITYTYFFTNYIYLLLYKLHIDV